MILLSYFSLLVICFLPYLIGKFQIGETHLSVNKDAQATFSRDQHDTVFAKRRFGFKGWRTNFLLWETYSSANQKRSVIR